MRRRQVRGGVFLHKVVRGVLRRCRAELWRIFHDQLDLDGNGRLDSEELMHALQRAGTSWTICGARCDSNPGSVRRHPAIPIYSGRVHDVHDVLVSLTCHNIPRVQRLPTVDAPDSVAQGDLPILRSPKSR